MTPEQTLTVITIVVLSGGVINAWVSLRVRGDIEALKAWTTKNFVAKDDCNIRHTDLREWTNNAAHH